ncbi:MAG: cytochrome c peroxidase family protein [Proteobacteria bacterium]|nr:cytochrome c peroxidase family protein [Pseudomonadota bacterium]
MRISKVAVPALLAGVVVGAQAAGNWQALPDRAPEPADNPTTVAKVELGKMLYFDPRFSSTGSVSCFSCHNVMEGGDDHMPTSIGVHGQKGGRNAPTVWNAAFHSAQFWDGRAATLEDQAKGPPVNPIEMGMTNLDAVILRIADIPGYRAYFRSAFGAGDVITMDNAARAIAAYERTLITPDSAYDRYVEGDETALTAQQVRGMEAFAAAGCTSCHSGPVFDGPELPIASWRPRSSARRSTTRRCRTSRFSWGRCRGRSRSRRCRGCRQRPATCSSRKAGGTPPVVQPLEGGCHLPAVALFLMDAPLHRRGQAPRLGLTPPPWGRLGTRYVETPISNLLGFREGTLSKPSPGFKAS